MDHIYGSSGALAQDNLGPSSSWSFLYLKAKTSEKYFETFLKDISQLFLQF